MTDPAYNWKIMGHNKQLRALEQDLKNGTLPHAYLFAGPPHIGKYTLARRLAAMLQCEKNGCGACGVCINIEKNYHSDTIELNDDGETIKIETMRNTLARLATTTPGKYKIFLVKNIERMTLEAANALLKTLEEPGSRVLFLFTSSAPEDLLPTIISRLRMMKFQSVLPGEIVKFLQEKYPFEPAEKLRTIVDLSYGLPGRAVHFAEHQEDFLAVQELFAKVRTILLQGDIVDKFSLVAAVTQDEKLFAEFFDIFLLALRYTMLDEAERGGSPEKIHNTLNVIKQTQQSLRLQKRNVNARLLFEHLMLQT